MLGEFHGSGFQVFLTKLGFVSFIGIKTIGFDDGW